MKALTYARYGSPEVLTLNDLPQPEPKPNEVLVRVKAVSLNASDVEFLRASPAYVRSWGIFRPTFKVLGSDIAGCVEAVGKDVTRFRVGDDVYGDLLYRWGGLAEYLCAPEAALLSKPAHLTYEEASTLPQAAVIALQGLRRCGEVKDGERVLINGAGGGAGTFAIQLAKRFGAHVTAVDNAGKLQRMQALGADEVIDYAADDYTRSSDPYDRIVDFVASRPVLAVKRVLKPSGSYTLVGGPMGRIFGTVLLGPVISAAGSQKLGLLIHKPVAKDIEYLAELCKTGAIKPVIDRCYPLDRAPDAFQRMCDGDVFGKVIVTP